MAGAKKAQGWSREFDTLIRAIGECKSKAEEDAIISREVEVFICQPGCVLVKVLFQTQNNTL